MLVSGFRALIYISNSLLHAIVDGIMEKLGKEDDDEESESEEKDDSSS